MVHIQLYKPHCKQPSAKKSSLFPVGDNLVSWYAILIQLAKLLAKSSDPYPFSHSILPSNDGNGLVSRDAWPFSARPCRHCAGLLAGDCCKAAAENWPLESKRLWLALYSTLPNLRNKWKIGWRFQFWVLWVDTFRLVTSSCWSTSSGAVRTWDATCWAIFLLVLHSFAEKSSLESLHSLLGFDPWVLLLPLSSNSKPECCCCRYHLTLSQVYSSLPKT